MTRPPDPPPPEAGVETPPRRRVLLLTHTGREAARDVARASLEALTARGIVVRLLAEEAADLGVGVDDTGAGLVELTTTEVDDTVISMVPNCTPSITSRSPPSAPPPWSWIL